MQLRRKKDISPILTGETRLNNPRIVGCCFRSDVSSSTHASNAKFDSHKTQSTIAGCGIYKFVSFSQVSFLSDILSSRWHCSNFMLFYSYKLKKIVKNETNPYRFLHYELLTTLFLYIWILVSF